MDGTSAIRVFVAVILLVASVIYVGSVVYAGYASWQDPHDPHVIEGKETEPTETWIPEPLTQAIILIGGALATHLGAVLGIEIRGGALKSGRTMVQTLRLAAAVLYFVSLLIGIGFWLADGLSPYSARVIRDMWYTLLGVCAGVIASLSAEQ